MGAEAKKLLGGWEVVGSGVLACSMRYEVDYLCSRIEPVLGHVASMLSFVHFHRYVGGSIVCERVCVHTLLAVHVGLDRMLLYRRLWTRVRVRATGSVHAGY